MSTKAITLQHSLWPRWSPSLCKRRSNFPRIPFVGGGDLGGVFSMQCGTFFKGCAQVKRVYNEEGACVYPQYIDLLRAIKGYLPTT